MWVFTLSPLFCNLLFPITLPKTILQAMVKNPPKSFFKKPHWFSIWHPWFLFVFSLLIGKFPPMLRAVENRASMQINPDFISRPPFLSSGWWLKRSSFRQVEHGTVGTLTSQFGSEIRLGKQSLHVGLVKLGYETRSFYLWKPWMERQEEAGMCVCVPICTCACCHFSLVYDGRSSQTCAILTSSRSLLFNFRLGCHHP